MFARLQSWNLMLAGALVCFTSLTHGQVLTDGDFMSGGYTSFTEGLGDIRFNIDYSSIDIFGDGFITATIPEAPRSGAVGGSATTGVFISANNDSLDLASGAISAAAIYPGLNLGNGTSTPDYKITVDVFHSTATGVYDPDTDMITIRGSTNNTIIGTNMATTSLALTGAAGTFGTVDNQQGQLVGITADGGAAEDYKPYYAGNEYRSRASSVAQDIETGEILRTGLASGAMNEFWAGEGFDRFGADTPDSEDNLNNFSGNAFFFSPDPNDPGSYDGTSGIEYFRSAFPVHNGGTHLNVPDLTTAGFGPNARVLLNDELTPADSPTNATRGDADGGVPYNEWTTHEIYYSATDDTFTYVIDGVPVVQMMIDANESSVGTNINSTISTAGDMLLGFYDRFGGSISVDPEGANFAIYDNLVVEAVDPNDIPDMNQYLVDNGFLPGGASEPGDNNGKP